LLVSKHAQVLVFCRQINQASPHTKEPCYDTKTFFYLSIFFFLEHDNGRNTNICFSMWMTKTHFQKTSMTKQTIQPPGYLTDNMYSHSDNHALYCWHWKCATNDWMIYL
jgi:hypothetical protein